MSRIIKTEQFPEDFAELQHAERDYFFEMLYLDNYGRLSNDLRQYILEELMIEVMRDNSAMRSRFRVRLLFIIKPFWLFSKHLNDEYATWNGSIKVAKLALGSAILSATLRCETKGLIERSTVKNFRYEIDSTGTNIKDLSKEVLIGDLGERFKDLVFNTGAITIFGTCDSLANIQDACGVEITTVFGDVEAGFKAGCGKVKIWN